jgi:hypothetical protein
VTHLYFIRAGEAASPHFDTSTVVKIGLAGVPSRRVKQLRTGNHLRLELAATVEVPDELALRIERALHGALASERLEGEWFAPSERIELLIANIDHGDTWEDVLRTLGVTL